MSVSDIDLSLLKNFCIIFLPSHIYYYQEDFPYVSYYVQIHKPFRSPRNPCRSYPGFPQPFPLRLDRRLFPCRPVLSHQRIPLEHLKLLFFPFLFVTLGTAALYRFRTGAFSTAVFSVFSADGFYSDFLLHLHRYLGHPRSDPGSSDLFSWRSPQFFRRQALLPHPEADPVCNFNLLLWGADIFFFFAFTCFPPGIPLFFPYG